MAIDWRSRREKDDPLDTWEVLAEEFEEGGQRLDDVLDTGAQKYFEAKEKLEYQKQQDERGKANPQDLGAAQEDFDRERRGVERDLFRQFHAHPRTALCFSGGGVRSATFGLGVLNGLAKLAPASPLPQFDFLSTVSGGGYLGGWFSAWAAAPASSAMMACLSCPRICSWACWSFCSIRTFSRRSVKTPTEPVGVVPS